MSSEARTYNKLSFEQQNKLISLVILHPYLYDTRDESYGVKAVLKTTWEKIARDMNVKGLDHEQCRLKWKNMRDYYNAICKKINKAAKEGSRIPYQGTLYKRLRFLANFTSNGKYKDRNHKDVGDEDNSCSMDMENDQDHKTGDISNHPVDKESQMEPQKKKICKDSSSVSHSSSTFGDSSSGQGAQLEIENLWEKMKTDYERLIDKGKELESELEEKKTELEKKESQIKGNAFYFMIAEKMAKFPLNDQVWMENQIWNLYMNLAMKTKGSGSDINANTNTSSSSCTNNNVFFATLT